MPTDLTLADLLTPDRVGVCLRVEDKAAVLDAVVGLVAGAEAVRDARRLGADVRAREAQMSTGVGAGLALPHARTPAVTRSVAAFATLDPPVDFDAIDGAPVDLLFVLLVPEAATDEHLELLRQIASMLDREEVRDRLRRATTGHELYQAVVDIQNGH